MPTTERPPYWHEVQHSMDKRNQQNNYRAGGKAYMVTLKVEGMVPILGEVREDGCHLTALGEMMRTAWLTLPQRFKNISIIDRPDEYVVMPEHFHGIVYVTGYMQEHLGEIIKVFKARVGMAYRKMMMDGTVRAVGTGVQWMAAYKELTPGQQEDMKAWVDRRLEALYSATGRRTQQGVNGQDSNGQEQEDDAPPFKIATSGGHGKVGFLFAAGYTDGLLLKEEDLEGHRQYILDNPMSRWKRSNNRRLLRANRNGIDTAVTLSALEGYLRRECTAYDVTEEKLAAVRGMLLLCSATRRRIEGRGMEPHRGMEPQKGMDPHSSIVCWSYGDRGLLEKRLLPVVCHRKDAGQFNKQMERCMEGARKGAVIVSACISKGEHIIFKAIMEAGYPVVRIEDNGFPEIYHPSQERITLCEAGQLLIVTPWVYHYRHKEDNVFVAYCKTMNCIAQALCRTKDSWWMD